MANLLSDQTWQRLDPEAGQLTPRQRRLAGLTMVAGVLLVALAVAVGASGLITPRVAGSWSAGGGAYSYGYHDETWTMHHTFEIRNAGAVSFKITGVGRSGPGLVPVDFPVEVAQQLEGEVNELGRLAPGERTILGVAYQVTDCAAVPDEPWPVPVHIARPWGTHSAWVELPPQSHEDFGLPPAYESGAAVASAFDIEWQRNMADAVCYHRDGAVPPQR